LNDDATCETAKLVQNAFYKAQYNQCQTQKEVEKLECERNKGELQAACEAGRRGPFSCDAEETMQHLSGIRVPAFDPTQQRSAWLTSGDTTLREGWIDTACVAHGAGTPYRDAVLSSDGFWTIDITLDSFSIGNVEKPKGARYLRLVVRPLKWGGGTAHDLVGSHYITAHDRIEFSGPVILNREAKILEVHPIDDLQVSPSH
jgi:hypothetical protein